MADDRFHRDARTAELQVSLHNSHKNNKKKIRFVPKPNNQFLKCLKCQKRKNVLPIGLNTFLDYMYRYSCLYDYLGFLSPQSNFMVGMTEVQKCPTDLLQQSWSISLICKKYKNTRGIVIFGFVFLKLFLFQNSRVKFEATWTPVKRSQHLKVFTNLSKFQSFSWLT